MSGRDPIDVLREGIGHIPHVAVRQRCASALAVLERQLNTNLRAMAAEAALADCKKYRDAETRALAKRCGAAENALAEANQQARDLADALREITDGSGSLPDSRVYDIARAALDRHTQADT